MNDDCEFSCVFPTRSMWKDENPTNGFDWKVYTDGSKVEWGCGAGFHVSNTHIKQSFKLLNINSIFQCEIFAIQIK